MLPSSLAIPPEAVCHYTSGRSEVNGGSETASGEVALVLDWLVAARGRQVLRHGGRVCRAFNWGGSLGWTSAVAELCSRELGFGSAWRLLALAVGWLSHPHKFVVDWWWTFAQHKTMSNFNMESEERPAKMRKLEHPVDAEKDISGSPAREEGHLGLNDILPPDEFIGEEYGANQEDKDLQADTEGESAAPKLSKNALKKQRRLERWEAGRDDRKAKRKEKIKAKKERRREEWNQNVAEEGASNTNGDGTIKPRLRSQPHPAWGGAQVPLTVIFDCAFEDLMFDNELKSLGLQITRCYSDNRKAKYRAHLALSSFGGKMKERFDGILAKQYTSWKGFQFFSEDFVEVAEKSKEWMSGSEGGKVAGALAEGSTEDEEGEGEIVYLSSESDNVLERLKPNSVYIIGGLVDKNRHKGMCYKRAMNRGIKTAKLPIGEFLHMKSRQVLVTNHVLEIMLKWMEFGDWGKAFMEVLPKRKGGVLKSENGEGEGEGQVEAVDEDDEDDIAVDLQPDEGEDATVAATHDGVSHNGAQGEVGATGSETVVDPPI